MNRFFVNLKRFDVPRSKGGVCPVDNPYDWIETVISTASTMQIENFKEMDIVFCIPEGLIGTAVGALAKTNDTAGYRTAIGCQGVHWLDINTGENFGAFSTLMPAKAAVNLGCRWAMVGHSEERRAKFQLLTRFNPAIETDPQLNKDALCTVDRVISEEVSCAAANGLNILFCIGETESQKGSGSVSEQQERTRNVLNEQISDGINAFKELETRPELVIGYEPIWAIGPGKTPPGPDYIAFVSEFIKETCRKDHGIEPDVVYGGGLKEENAADIAAVKSIDGGLVALTRFTGEIGYYPEDFKKIVSTYLESAA